MKTVELSAGPIDYLDSGGNGPVVVLCHGVPMDHRQWRKVIPLLDGFRVVAPVLPMGGHRWPMRPDADLSQRGMALLLADFLDALDLTDVTLVLNDWGGGQFMISEGRADRLGRLVLVACEAFDNFPPGPAKIMERAAPLPGGMRLLIALMRIPAFRRMRGGYGGMSLRGLPDELVLDWFTPARRDARIRRDFAKFAAGAPDRDTLLAWADRLRSFDRPVLVVWAEEDRLMPAEHGPRLAALFPHGKLVTLANSATLVPEDQPEQLAELIKEFVRESPTADPEDTRKGPS